MLQVLNDLEREGLLGEGYAIGGATALIFYTEPVTTADVDVFAFLKSESELIDFPILFTNLKKRGYPIDGEHFIIEGIKVQFLPASQGLVEEAVKTASTENYGETATKVIGLEHLIAIMLQTGRTKDKLRIAMILEANVNFNKKKLMEILDKYNLRRQWDKIINEDKENT